MGTSHTLESVHLEMDHWRRTKTGLGRIPDRIWSNAIGLIGKHSMSEICRVLRLSYNQFKAKLKHQDLFTLKSDNPSMKSLCHP